MRSTGSFLQTTEVAYAEAGCSHVWRFAAVYIASITALRAAASRALTRGMPSLPPTASSNSSKA
mgnify:CR=1 FL=1